MNEKEKKQYEQLVLKPIPPLIVSLAVPTTISMMVSMIYNLVDAYFVGKLGTSAAAAIGILVSVSAVFQAIGFMCGHGSGGRISMELGHGHKAHADVYASTGFFASLSLGVILAALGLLLITPLMYMLGSTDTILPYARTYGFYILLSAPALSASCTLNNIMRYEGKASLAMIGLVSGGVINMIGDPILMFGFHMGIAGAGLSTALSQWISFGILLYMFLAHKTITELSLKNFHPFSLDMAKIMGNGAPSLVRQTLNSVAAMALNIAANPYGDAAIAAMAIVGRIALFFGSIMTGIGQGLQPVSAYNYGAHKFKRVHQGVIFTFLLGEAVLGCFAVLGFIFDKQLIMLFRDDPKVVEIGTLALRLQCVALLFQSLTIIGNMTFQAIGQSLKATFLASLRTGVYYLPAIIILPHFFGLLGIQMSQTVADICAALTNLPFLLVFLKGLPDANEHVAIDDEYA